MSAREIALLLPGQGSQFVGMGRELAFSHPRAAEAFEHANDVLGFDLRRICWEGPEDDLTRTVNSRARSPNTALIAIVSVASLAGV
ncbi:[acyl-carrier-protein] S-malonyltransferase, partial [Gemmatimonadota bacterium]